MQIDLGRDSATGKRRRRRFTVHGTKRDAQIAARRALAERDGGLVATPERLAVGEYLDRWLTDHARPRVKARTLATYRQTIDLFRERLGAVLLRDLRPDHIQAAVAAYIATGRTNRTAKKHFIVLRGALRQAVLLGLIPRNPADVISPPRPERREMRTADAATLRLIFDGCPNADRRRFLYCAVQTGLRLGELLGLKWSDVDWEQSQLHIQRARDSFEPSGFSEPKAHSRRSISVSKSTLDVLREHRVAQVEQRLLLGAAWRAFDLIFPRANGQPESTNNMSNWWWRLSKTLGLDGLRLHDLRHTSATMALKAGVHPKVVQERLGHSTISVTLDTYSHVLPNMQREAADAIDALVPRLDGRASAP